MTDDIEELRKAMEDMYCDERWVSGFPSVNGVALTDGDCLVSQNGLHIASVGTCGMWAGGNVNVGGQITARYIAAANPVVIRQLLSELDRLRALETLLGWK